MRLRILGAHGGESSTHRASSFLVDNNLLLDAGAVTRSLTLNEQLELDYIFISHSHLDHIRDLALLCDNLIAEKNATHGYAIWVSLGKKKTIQSIYHHLDSLNQDGLIEFQEVGNTKKCIITNKGQDMLNKMREIIDLREI